MIHEDKIEFEPNSGCWLWTGSIDRDGYGRARYKGVPRRAHRILYETERGPIPAGLVLDHKCRNPGCVNPDHLEPVTQAENIRRSPISINTINAAKTHCIKGHPLTPENTRPQSGGGRICATCRSEQNARCYQERKRVRS